MATRDYTEHTGEITPRAWTLTVKQLVRKFENALRTQLVKRSGRGLTLTPAARAGFEDLAGGFSQIHDAVTRMHSFNYRRRLIVSAEPSFATAWLVSRLQRFRMANPDVDVLIDSSMEIVNLDKGITDVAVRFGADPQHSDHWSILPPPHQFHADPALTFLPCPPENPINACHMIHRSFSLPGLFSREQLSCCAALFWFTVIAGRGRWLLYRTSLAVARSER